MKLRFALSIFFIVLCFSMTLTFVLLVEPFFRWLRVEYLGN